MTETLFTENQYRAYQERVDKYIQAAAKSLDIPRKVLQADATEYKASKRPKPADPRRETMMSLEGFNNTPHLEPTTFYLTLSHDAALIPKDVEAISGDNLLADSVMAQTDNVIQDAEKIIFGGDTATANIGIVAAGTASSVAIGAGSDSDLTAYGDFINAINKHLATIPSRLREMGVGVNIYMTQGMYLQLTTNTNTTTGETEFDAVKNAFMSPSTDPSMRVNKIIATNALLGSTTPSTSNQVMVTLIPDPSIVEVAVSRGVGIIGEEEHATSYEVHTGWKGAGCVKDASGVIYSTAVTCTNAGL